MPIFDQKFRPPPVKVGFMKLLWLCLILIPASSILAQKPPKTFAIIDATGSDWRQLGGDDFVNVNCREETWEWNDGYAKCNGQPVGVIRTKETFENFELVAQWRHMEFGGNSGIFIWAPTDGFEGLKPGQFPAAGIEVQILDEGYTKKYSDSTGKSADWFTTQGDVFPVNKATMKPFPPLSPNGNRSFPSGEFTLPSPEWNSYYVRAINGEVRLWVNGHEVSGGNDCEPAMGHICLESEGAPVEFNNIKIRVLP
jgi:hypothetical protein